MSDAARPRAFATFRRLLGEVRGYGWHVAAIVALQLLATPLALLNPLPLRIAVDSVIGDRPLPDFVAPFVPGWVAASDTAILIFSAALLLVVMLATYGQGVGIWVLQTWTGESVVQRFRAKLFDRLQYAALDYHDRKGTADSLYRVQYDAVAPQGAIVNGVIPLVSSLFVIFGMIAVTATIDWRLALIALAICPALFLLTTAFGRSLRESWLKLKTEESNAMGVAQEVLGAIRVVKAFGREPSENERFVRHLGLAVREYMRLARMHGAFDLSVGMVIGVGTAAILVIGVGSVKSGAMTLGELLLVMGYVAQIYRPLETISKKLTDLQASIACAERAFALLDDAPSVAERADARPLARARGEIEFDRVSFGYGATPVLREVTFRAPAGAKIGVFGASGAGKSTLVALLNRFYDPTAGRILVDGVDSRDWRIADLRHQFALVPQDTVLFSTTIGENILYGRPDATEDEVIAAARGANVHDFIAALPEGYGTPVGERGLRLSGGQRQRIALARAFLKDAPILVLDEPTSAVDPRSEAAILDALDRLMRGRTSFIIAHRDTMLAGCDLWVQIADGRIVATGRGNAPVGGRELLAAVGGRAS